jgi:YD repeat-containing protein
MSSVELRRPPIVEFELRHPSDAQNRLATTQNFQGTAWGLSFNYDGFGNRLDQTLTSGTAPSMSLTYDQTTNRILTTGYSYDANGNLKAMLGSRNFSYD